jgi:hypothetical protein
MRHPVLQYASFFITFVLIGAPLLHNSIPHSHGSNTFARQDFSRDHYDHAHHHSEKPTESREQRKTENPVWKSLHEAVLRESKKLVIALIHEDTSAVN